MKFPEWWFIVSGVFFGLAIVLTILMAVLIYVLINTVRKLQVQVETLTKRAEEIGVEVKAITQQVNRLTQQTVVRAERFGGAMDLVSSQMASRSQWIGAGLTIFNVLRAMLKRKR